MHLNNILILPDEIITNILKYTDYKTLIACRRSCRRFNEVVEASSALRYIVELAASGMCDGPPNDIVPAERLRRLLGMQTAWKTSGWTLIDDFPYSRDPHVVMTSGNLVVFRSSRSRSTVELILLRFPSKSRGIPEQIWYLHFPSDGLEPSCADDSQDLLVFSCSTTIQVRTLSTGGVHPLTTNGGTIHPLSVSGAFILCTHGDLVFIVAGPPSLVRVWNWKTGEQISTIPLPLTTICVPFLDRNHVISMHYDISRPPTIAFQVMTLPDVAGNAPSHTYRFLLEPPFAVPPYFTKLHANTLPANWSSRRSSSAHDPAGCFHVNPDEKLLALELSLRNTEERTTSFTQHTLNVPHAAFLSHIAAHRAACACAPAADAAAGPVVVVPWHAWSPGRTHLTTVPNVSLRDLGRHRVCGMHALGEPHLLLDRGILRIADYHPHRVARARAAATVPVGSGDDDPAVAAVGAEEGEEGQEEPDCDHDHDTARGEPPRGGVQAQIPYVEKDIPLPEGLRSGHVRCILGEDVVVLLEFAVRGPGNPAHRIEKIYYHPI